MKFKYLGQDNTFCLELVAYNITNKNEYLKKGQVIDVPDSNDTLINSLNTSGLFKKVNVTTNKSKKKEKE